MKKRVLVGLSVGVLLILVRGVLFAANNSIEGPGVTLRAEGPQSLKMIFDSDKKGNLYDETKEVVHLQSPSEHINPVWGFGSDAFYVTTGVDAELTTFGTIQHKSIEIDGEEREIYAFRREGPGEKAIGSDSTGSVWAIGDDGVITLIGKIQHRKITFPDGEEGKLLMQRGKATNAKWIGDTGDGVYEEGANGKLTQIGYVGWRLITLQDGRRIPIIMTKGMSKSSRWKGRYNGKLYND